MENLTILGIFAAGLLSFLSPCVLPLVPGYISFISGISIERLTQQGKGFLFKVFVNSLLFIFGFSLIFIGMGASATYIGGFIAVHKWLLMQIAGLIIILFGIHLLGLFPLKFLYRERRFQLSAKPLGILGSLVVGAAFAFGWTPCIGPILGSIILIAITKDTLMEGVGLLSIYSLGLGLPFLLTSLMINYFFTFFKRIKNHLRKVEIAAGALLITFGVLILTGNFTMLSTYLNLWGNF